MSESLKLTKAMRASLAYILDRGPGTLPSTSQAKIPAHVSRLIEAGCLETLNRLRPGPAMYEITETGRAALSLSTPSEQQEGEIRGDFTADPSPASRSPRQHDDGEG